VALFQPITENIEKKLEKTVFAVTKPGQKPRQHDIS